MCQEHNLFAKKYPAHLVPTNHLCDRSVKESPMTLLAVLQTIYLIYFIN